MTQPKDAKETERSGDRAPSPAERKEKVRDLMAKFSTAVLVTRGRSEPPIHARPMDLALCEDNGDVWFATNFDSQKVREIAEDPEVCVVMQDGRTCLTLTGRVEVVQNKARIDELWKDSWKVWFPQGKEDPRLTLLHVETRSGEYWDSDGLEGIRYLVRAAKAYFTKDGPPPSGGLTHNRVHL